MTTQTTNEAAERLHRNIDIFMPTTYKQAKGQLHADADEAIAVAKAEGAREAVQRVRRRINAAVAAGSLGIGRGAFQAVLAILAEELAR